MLRGNENLDAIARTLSNVASLTSLPPSGVGKQCKLFLPAVCQRSLFACLESDTGHPIKQTVQGLRLLALRCQLKPQLLQPSAASELQLLPRSDRGLMTNSLSGPLILSFKLRSPWQVSICLSFHKTIP